MTAETEEICEPCEDGDHVFHVRGRCSLSHCACAMVVSGETGGGLPDLFPIEEPDNHHNALVCAYCRPGAERRLADQEARVEAAFAGIRCALMHWQPEGVSKAVSCADCQSWAENIAMPFFRANLNPDTKKD